MVYAIVSSSWFHYLFISVADMKEPYSIFDFEGYKISFREPLMLFIFPRFSLSRGNHTNLNCVFVSEILLKEIIFDMKQKIFFKKWICLKAGFLWSFKLRKHSGDIWRLCRTDLWKHFDIRKKWSEWAIFSFVTRISSQASSYILICPDDHFFFFADSFKLAESNNDQTGKG